MSAPIGILSYFERESFVCVTGETALDATSPHAFLEAAVELMNDRLWGTLAAAITVPDAWQKRDPASLEAAIGRLRYGTIGINLWPGVAYALMSPPWGAFPGSTLSDVQSGLGFVHNTYLLGNPQKTVLRAPLSFSPKPVWFSTHRRPEIVAAKLCRLYSQPSIWKIPEASWRKRAAWLTRRRCNRCSIKTHACTTRELNHFAVLRGRFACRSRVPSARRPWCRRRSRTSFPEMSAGRRGRWPTDRGCTG